MILAAAELNATALLLGTVGLLLALSALLGRTAERSGVPLVFLFLALGMLAGSEGVGGIPFDDYQLSFRLGTAALVLILLDGGLNTPLRSVKENWVPALVLATLGVATTAALVALFALWVGLTWQEAVLLGAVVSSTDAAAVFAVLRGSGVRLRSRVAGTIELESGINDPMAVILTMAATALLLGGGASATGLAVDVPVQLVVGGVVGLAAGYGARALLARTRLSTAGLYPVLTLGLGMLAFAAATLLRGSGFLAVFVAAVVLGNGPMPYHSGLSRIHDALAWLSQVAMFLVLGLLVFPSQVWAVAGEGFLIALFLSLIARPLAVLLCLAPLRIPLLEVAYVGWVGLRGAVPIILATIPILAGVPGAMKVFNIVFFVVVMSALLPGPTIGWAARRFGLAEDSTPQRPAVLEMTSMQSLRGELLSFYISEPLAVCNARLADVPFPPRAAAMLVIRGTELIAARGDTQLLRGDHVYVFCRPEDRPFIELLFGRPQE